MFEIFMSTSASIPRRVTVKDVAARAGVQHASVCVVLNGAGGNTRVSPDARARIVAAARELGYKRNGAMVAARTGHFGCVALLLSTDAHRSNLPQPLLNGILDELGAHNLHLTIARLPDEQLTGAPSPKTLREWMADGLLVDYTHRIPPPLLEQIRAHQMPAVWLNSHQPSDCVFPDDQSAAALLTRHLIGLGHRRIAYLDFTNDLNDANAHYSMRERMGGYRAAMQEAQLAARVEPSVKFSQGVPMAQRTAFVRALLGEAARPTALIFYGDIELDLVAACAPELRLRVPRDLSLASFLAPGARYPGLELTTCAVPENQMGRVAIEMLRQKIADPTQILAPRPLTFEFHAGQTATPLSSSV